MLMIIEVLAILRVAYTLSSSLLLGRPASALRQECTKAGMNGSGFGVEGFGTFKVRLKVWVKGFRVEEFVDLRDAT